MKKIQKARKGTRTVDTPVITEYLLYPTDTTFWAHTPGQFISDVRVKLDGDDSTFQLYSPGDYELGTKVEKGDPDWQMYYDRYKNDFEQKKKQGDVKYRKSLMKTIWDFITGKKQKGGNINYLQFML